MTPEDALKLARQLADEHAEAKPAAQTSEGVHTVAGSEAADPALVEPHPFLHDREMRDALRIVNLIAAGRNPFSDEPFEKLRFEHRDSVLQALCIVVSSLTHRAHEPPRQPDTLPSVGENRDPSSKRPLEEYLQRIEREAILEALAETHYNRTAAAKLLGITFRALRYRMESLGLGE